MPVDCVLTIEINRLGEVFDGLIEVEKPVPDKTSPVIRGRISLIQVKHLVEVFECLCESIAPHFLSDRPQVMQCRDVVSLQLNRLYVVVLCLLELADLVPAERTVVVRLEMLRVELYGLRVVHYGQLVLALLPVGEPSIVVEIRFVTLQVDCLRETVDRLVEIAFPVQADALVVVGESVVGVDADRCRVVLNGPVELADFVKRETTVKECLEMRWKDL